jgi:uncharacterized protein YlxW (UPF0749 family)
MDKKYEIKIQENNTLKEIVDRSRAEVQNLKKKVSVYEDKLD